MASKRWDGREGRGEASGRRGSPSLGDTLEGSGNPREQVYRVVYLCVDQQFSHISK